jgi:hypothetical protein
MLVGKSKLYRKMMFTPRLNLCCDGVKIKCAYVKNESGSGWLIENLDNDGQTVWHKGLMTNDVVDIIVKKYEEINITWSRS